MSPAGSDIEVPVPDLLRELEALRGRLDRAQSWFHRPQDSMKAGAMAEEVKRLCQEASRSEDEAEIAESITRAHKLLNGLQVLIGLH